MNATQMGLPPPPAPRLAVSDSQRVTPPPSSPDTEPAQEAAGEVLAAGSDPGAPLLESSAVEPAETADELGSRPTERSGSVSVSESMSGQLRVAAAETMLKTPGGTQRATPTPGRVVSRGESAEQLVGAVVGEYEVGDIIGEGGMGTVYSARHPVIGKRAAVKVIAEHLCRDADAVGRFVQEARTVNEIGHPNIVDIFSFGQLEDGRSYFLMEFLQGETLATRLERGPLPLGSALGILDQVLAAIETAHAKGIIHRDLKPDNVYLVRGPTGEQVKLLDFGIAKLQSPAPHIRTTATGILLGTPLYMAPEQAKGAAVNAAADVYALGGMVYEMLAGEPPFWANNAAEVISMHLTATPPRVRQSVREVPPALDDLVNRMLAKDPAARPMAGDVRAAVREMLEGPSVTVRTAAVLSTEVESIDTADVADVPPRSSQLPLTAAIGLGVAAVAALVFWLVASSMSKPERASGDDPGGEAKARATEEATSRGGASADREATEPAAPPAAATETPASPAAADTPAAGTPPAETPSTGTPPAAATESGSDTPAAAAAAPAGAGDDATAAGATPAAASTPSTAGRASDDDAEDDKSRRRRRDRDDEDDDKSRRRRHRSRSEESSAPSTTSTPEPPREDPSRRKKERRRDKADAPIDDPFRR